MGVLATDENELIYIYSSTTYLGKKILSYAESIKKSVRTIDISKEKITGTIWLEIADMLNSSLDKLFTIEYLGKSTRGAVSDFDTEDWIKIIHKNPSLLQHPIVIEGKRAKIINDIADFFSFTDADTGSFEGS